MIMTGYLFFSSLQVDKTAFYALGRKMSYLGHKMSYYCT